jgi:hypothetical protein
LCDSEIFFQINRADFFFFIIKPHALTREKHNRIASPQFFLPVQKAGKQKLREAGKEKT